MLLTFILKYSVPTFTFLLTFILTLKYRFMCFITVFPNWPRMQFEQIKLIACWLSRVTRLTEMSHARQLTGTQWGRTIFWQKSYHTKRSFKLISTSCHLFPLEYQHNSDNRLFFSYLQVSIFCGRLFDDYFANQVACAKILVTVALKAPSTRIRIFESPTFSFRIRNYPHPHVMWSKRIHIEFARPHIFGFTPDWQNCPTLNGSSRSHPKSSRTALLSYSFQLFLLPVLSGR